MSWRIRGSYFESCNCEAICPCRRVGGRPGGRSTHGICMGALSWVVTAGRAGASDLSGLGAVLSFRYSDDEHRARDRGRAGAGRARREQGGSARPQRERREGSRERQPYGTVPRDRVVGGTWVEFS